MISPGAFTTSSQFAIHLNEVASSFGKLKKCLCDGVVKIRYPHRNLACLQHEKIPHLHLENLPSDWLKTVNVPNTKWVNENYPTWKVSYISAESFLQNKHGWLQPFESHCSPLYTSRMTPKRTLFIQTNIQRRHFFSFPLKSRGPKGLILKLEEIANSHVNDPQIQAQYLSAIVDEDPDYVIRRCESQKYASNAKVEAIYKKALLSKAQDQAGSKSRPLYVVEKATKDSKGWMLLKILGFGLLLSLLMSMPKNFKLPDLTKDKTYKPDRTKRNVKFDDVRGCDEVKAELQEVVEFLRNAEKFESLGAKLPCGILLTGRPGTGKTLLARAIAGEADVPFFFASGSEFDEMFVGTGAARMRKLFEAAKEHAPCIIFIDELDAVGGKRNNTQQYANMTLNQLLVELDGFDQTSGIIIIGATNFPEILDKALTRPGRFDSKVHVPLPDVRGRTDILRLYMEKSPCADDVDAEVIARITMGFSGADLMNLINQAALRAASLQLPVITKEHIQWAFDKIIMGPERKNAVIEEECKINTAYHEGGHAIVALFTKDAETVHKATIIPRGQALGYIMQLPHTNETSRSRKQLLASIDVTMGGRAAEEMIFGKESITTGASSDMKAASDIARKMVTQYGMSDKIGTVLINEKQDEISPELQKLIESEVKRIIEEAYIRAKDILRKHSKEHKRLAEALLKYETLDAKEIDLVIKGLPLENK